jgi:hypothetical protein
MSREASLIFIGPLLFCVPSGFPLGITVIAFKVAVVWKAHIPHMAKSIGGFHGQSMEARDNYIYTTLRKIASMYAVFQVCMTIFRNYSGRSGNV